MNARMMVFWALACACASSVPLTAPQEVAAPESAPRPGGLLTDPLPTDSVYQLQTALVDQHGALTALDVHRGHPVILSMFYASCPTACPMLIEDVRALERSLSEAEREDLRVVLVSLDPERDTPEMLAEVVVRHGVDDARWTLVRPGVEDVRAIAAALGIRYRATSNGEMNHTSLLTLLDVNGRPVARLEGLKRDAQPLRDALVLARRGAR